MIYWKNCAPNRKQIRSTAIQIIALSITSNDYIEQLHRIIPCQPAPAINGKEKIHDISFPYLVSLIIFLSKYI
jgi:hypothetical protein